MNTHIHMYMYLQDGESDLNVSSPDEDLSPGVVPTSQSAQERKVCVLLLICHIPSMYM